jgi:dephospho-CoA kinase
MKPYLDVQDGESRPRPSFHRCKPVIGLLGGIGSGKSQVATILARHGGRVVAADELAHEALRQPELKAQLVTRWGTEILDEYGEVVRRHLAAIIFRSPEERKALEAIVHPWIKQRIRQEVDKAARDAAVRFVVLDAAVMLEAGWDDVCDRLVFVEAPPDVRLRRVAEQRGWTAEHLHDRERAQLPLTAKASQADHVVHNATTLDDLTRQVDDLLPLWGLDSYEERPPRPDTRGRMTDVRNPKP